MKRKTTIFLFLLFVIASYGQDNSVNVHLNVKHTVGNISEFDRSKFMVLHSSLTEGDWNGEDDKMDYVLEDLDVYLGRDNGGMGWYMNQANENSSKPGFVDPNYMLTQGEFVRETRYGTNLASRHKYDNRSDVLVGGQERPFWPGHSTNPCCGGSPWAIDGAEASGDYMGQYLNQFFRNPGESVTEGMLRPRFMEIINEPLYGLVTTGTHTPLEVFQYHNEVADAIRVHNQDVLIGGYTAAFPVFEENNFQRWHDRMKLFIDTSGDKMDFFSIHLYDFNKHHINNGTAFEGPRNFKGGRIEATFDMIEQYSSLALNEIKPFIISEYGGRDHSIEWKEWTPERDWHFMKAISPMMMQFMERPDIILKTVPFIVLKAEWGRTSVPYPWRLMRQQKEASGQTGDNWVFTELIKFYELWSDVNGTRIETKTSNLDIMADAYVDGNKVYVIVNNLNYTSEVVNLNLFGDLGNTLESIKVKQLHLNGNAPVLEEEDLTASFNLDYTLDIEATAIIEYTFADDLVIDETEQEVKYYADSYLKPISANSAQNLQIDGIALTSYNEGSLRIGFGRDHGKSKQPKVLFNGTEVNVPNNFRGDDQNKRSQFFTLLEIPISEDLIQTNNTITVEFPDDGGYISTVTMQVFNFSSNIRVINPSSLPANNYRVQAIDATCVSSNNGSINITTVQPHNYKASITGNNYNETIDFTNTLNADNLQPGEYTVSITMSDFPEYNILFTLNIEEPESLSVTSKVSTSKDVVALSLSGSNNYVIDLNGKIINTSSSEITLELKEGHNDLLVTTEKECQGIYKETLFIDKSVILFPNPVNNELSITVSDKLLNSTAYVYNVMGSVVDKVTMLQTHNKLQVNKLKKGVYFISFQKNDERVGFSKFVVN